MYRKQGKVPYRAIILRQYMNRKIITTFSLVGMALLAKDIGDQCFMSVDQRKDLNFSKPFVQSLPCLFNSSNLELPDTRSDRPQFPTVNTDYMTASGTVSSIATTSVYKIRYKLSIFIP